MAGVQGWNMAMCNPELELPNEIDDLDKLIAARIPDKMKVSAYLQRCPRAHLSALDGDDCQSKMGTNHVA